MSRRYLESNSLLKLAVRAHCFVESLQTLLNSVTQPDQSLHFSFSNGLFFIAKRLEKFLLDLTQLFMLRDLYHFVNFCVGVVLLL